MTCESWEAKIDIYLDGELPLEEARALDTHLRACPSCASDALSRVQIKRAVQIAGKRFTPRLEFRQKLQKTISHKRRPALFSYWMPVLATALVLFVVFISFQWSGRAASSRTFSEIADLHVASLASASPVDVVSSDRHTVKPWFQGKIPFTFNLPELQSTDFTLLGGRVTYLNQTPGAHLIYELRQHRISVFIFPEETMRARLSQSAPRELTFSMKSWSAKGLRYFEIGDAGPGDLDTLAELFKKVNGK